MLIQQSKSQKSTVLNLNLNLNDNDNDAKGSRDKKQLIEVDRAMRKPIGKAVLCIALDKKK
jgi:hypothetical protein